MMHHTKQRLKSILEEKIKTELAIYLLIVKFNTAEVGSVRVFGNIFCCLHTDFYFS